MADSRTKLVVIVAVAVAVGRMFVTPRLTAIPSIEGTYEALAHLFVGFLILVPFYDPKRLLGPSKLYGWLGWMLGIWELIWFVVQKVHHG